MISHTTPDGSSPASRARSTAASVCPMRSRTPPGFARNGNTCPGCTRSCAVESEWIATWIVRLRSAAEMPVVTPCARFDADREGGAERRLVVVGHRAQAQMVGALLGETQTDQPARVGRHEVDRLGRRELGRNRQVALVLAVGIVDDDDHPALADVLDRFLDRREGRGHGHPRRLAGEQLLDVLGEHVGLEIDARLPPRARRASSRSACAGSTRRRSRPRRPRQRSGSFPGRRSTPSRRHNGARPAVRRTRSACRRLRARRERTLPTPSTCPWT